MVDFMRRVKALESALADQQEKGATIADLEWSFSHMDQEEAPNIWRRLGYTWADFLHLHQTQELRFSGKTRPMTGHKR